MIHGFSDNFFKKAGNVGIEGGRFGINAFIDFSDTVGVKRTGEGIFTGNHFIKKHAI